MDKREARYWAKVDRRGPNDCWPWTACRNAFGYGMFRGVVEQLAHRYGYRLEHGAIAAGMLICHHCDNPPCQNPRHLYAGTPADNSDDKMSRGRFRRVHQAGSVNGRAKLTASDVTELRGLRDQGWTQTALAERFGVAQSQVSRIVRRLEWSESD